MWVWDWATLQFVEVNAAAVETYGYSREECLAVRVTDTRRSEDVPRLLETLVRQCDQVSLFDQTRHRTRDGSVIDVEVAASRLTFAGRDAALDLNLDVTEGKLVEQELRRSEARYRTLVETSADAIILLADDGRVVMANQQAALMHGYSDPADLLGRRALDLLAPEDRPRLLQNAQRLATTDMLRNVEYLGLRKDGTVFPEESSAGLVPATEDQPAGAVIIIRDITARKALEKKLRDQVLHDDLTGLPNRTLLGERIGHAIQRAERELNSLALLLVDLNRFKLINDTFGHAYGDRLLQAVGERFGSLIRGIDTVARLAGDEFAILLEGSDARGAATFANALGLALEEPYVIDGHNLYIGGCFGIAVCPEHGTDSQTLLQHADIAMYRAKEHGQLFEVYDAAQDPHTPQTMTLVGDLRSAIGGDELLLYCQPLIVPSTSVVRGVEALARWRHPRYGWVPPSRFIELAEHSGIIRSLTVWILNAALAQCAAWQQQDMPMNIAVNLSARNLDDPSLVETITRSLEHWKIDPTFLTLEITETSIMLSPLAAMNAVTRLHAMGIRVAIDDFGTGYSSLSYLKKLPAEAIKIDKSFVLNLGEDVGDVAIVNAIAELGHTLGLEVVAEGVESLGSLGIVTECGCDTAQGYFICPPVPSGEIVPWTRSWMQHALAHRCEVEN